VEAPLPDGFPTYTPVGEIEVKHYPAYRKAEATGGIAFWTLFQHIKDRGYLHDRARGNDLPKEGRPVGRERSMAFLYGDKSTGVRAGMEMWKW